MNSIACFYVFPMLFVVVRRNLLGFLVEINKKSYEITPITYDKQRKNVEKRYTIHRVGCICSSIDEKPYYRFQLFVPTHVNGGGIRGFCCWTPEWSGETRAKISRIRLMEESLPVICHIC